MHVHLLMLYPFKERTCSDLGADSDTLVGSTHYRYVGKLLVYSSYRVTIPA